MVLTVTTNPLLEYRFEINSLKPNSTMRAVEEYNYAGGKGINVSRQLSKLQLKNQALLFLGGLNGKKLRKSIEADGINFSVVNTKSETRTASLLMSKEDGNVTTVIGKNSPPGSKEIEEFKNRMEKMMTNCSTVVFAGSSPSEEAGEIFKYGIGLANSLDKVSVIDTYGSLLKDCIDKAPTVLHNNVTELESSLAVKLSEEKDKLDFLNYLYSKGIKLAFITDGGNESYASKFDFKYKMIPPEIDVMDATGSGDAFVAGVVYGFEKSMVFDDIIKFASAAGAANAASWETCSSDITLIEKFIESVDIVPVGKKMKIINDDPTI
jgi:1-phosphofructokinase family hexose kinase